jgi:sugar phosphate isomerase/epimerase
MAIACSTSIRSGAPLEEALAHVAGLGFANVDILTIDGWAHVNTRDMADRWEETIARVDRLLQEHRLTPIATNSGVSPQLHHRAPEVNAQRLREIDALVRFMNRFGIGVGAIQPRQPDAERPWEDVLADCVATLREQFAAGEQGGVAFALELHVRSPFETLEQTRRLFQVMPDVKVVYDPTHAVSQGIPLRETEWLIDHARHVHLRDAAPGQLQAPFGEGEVDFHWVLETLKDHGYNGHFSIEYFSSREFDADDSVRKLRDTIARYFEP